MKSFAWVVSTGLLLFAPVLLAPVSARAQSGTLNVQVINVCDDGGSNCALSNPYAGISYNPANIQRIFNQAGIAVNLLAPVNYNSSAYLNPAVVDDPADGYLTGSPTDAAHQLLSLPGHDQNTDNQVLNLFVVNSLPHSSATNGVYTPASTLFGLGLQNANGAVVTTGVTAPDANGVQYVSGIDNIAHELAHNLGLVHVDATAQASPFNLMQGSGRYVPVTVCGIVGVPCDASGNVVAASDPAARTVGQKDALTAGQIATLQSSVANLFTVNLASATLDASPTEEGGCVNGGINCPLSVTYNSSPTDQSLLGYKVRFRIATQGDVNGGITLAPNSEGTRECGPTYSSNTLPGGDAEVDASYPSGCLLPGSQASAIAYSNAATSAVVAGSTRTTSTIYDLAPFSAQFVFSDGVTSTALFDSSGIAQSTRPIALSNSNSSFPNGPGLFVPTDPAAFNALSVLDDDPTTIVLPNGTVVAANEITAVPEPASAVLLAAGLLPLVLRRRRP